MRERRQGGRTDERKNNESTYVIVTVYTHLYQFEKIFEKFFVIHSHQVILLDNTIVFNFCVIAKRRREGDGGREGRREGGRERGRKKGEEGREKRRKREMQKAKGGRKESSNNPFTASQSLTGRTTCSPLCSFDSP